MKNFIGNLLVVSGIVGGLVEILILKEKCKMDINTIKDKLKEQIFDNGKMITLEEDSCNFHNLCHDDTEILGMFCDYTGFHREEIKDILLDGYLNRLKQI